MAFVNLAKVAAFAFLICTMASTFGSGAEMVIKEVVSNTDENWSKVGEMCSAEKIRELTKQASSYTCSPKGLCCFPEFGLQCCEGLLCKRPWVVPGTCLEP